MPVSPSYHERKAAGICTQCGANPAREGRITCESCSQMQNEYGKVRYKNRKNAKQCVDCGATLKPEDTTARCQFCRVSMNNSVRLGSRHPDTLSSRVRFLLRAIEQQQSLLVRMQEELTAIQDTLR